MKGINIQRPAFKDTPARTSKKVQRSQPGNFIFELKREFRVSSKLTELFFGKPFHQGSISYIDQDQSTATLQVQEGHYTPTATTGLRSWRTGCRMACRRTMVATTTVPLQQRCMASVAPVATRGPLHPHHESPALAFAYEALFSCLASRLPGCVIFFLLPLLVDHFSPVESDLLLFFCVFPRTTLKLSSAPFPLQLRNATWRVYVLQ